MAWPAGRWWWGVGLVAGAAGCATAAREARADLTRVLEAADELAARGAYAAARQQLEVALGVTEPLAADDLRLAICETFAREGRTAEAAACYLGLEGQLAGDEGRSLAAYRRATLLLGQGDEPGAVVGYTRALEQWPGTDGSGRALRSLRALARLAGGITAELERLQWAAERLCAAAPAARPLCCEAAVSGARLALEEVGEPAAAAIWLDRCPLADAGAWVDDLLWWRSRIAKASGDRRAEADYCRQLIDRRESSWFFGSYESTYLDDAWLALAEALEAQGELAAARATYVELINEAPQSRLVDDAAFGAARLDFGRGDRRSLQRFLADFPESRHARQAREMLGEP